MNSVHHFSANGLFKDKSMHMISLVVASNNQHKVTEIRKILPKCFDLVSLKDAGITSELPETKGTIIGNATQKASFVWEATGIECLADDSGLEIEALEGRPGVDSAHYSGFPISPDRNMELVLSQLQGSKNRKASFVTVLALIQEGVTILKVAFLEPFQRRKEVKMVLVMTPFLFPMDNYSPSLKWTKK